MDLPEQEYRYDSTCKGPDRIGATFQDSNDGTLFLGKPPIKPDLGIGKK